MKSFATNSSLLVTPTHFPLNFQRIWRHHASHSKIPAPRVENQGIKCRSQSPRYIPSRAIRVLSLGLKNSMTATRGRSELHLFNLQVFFRATQVALTHKPHVSSGPIGAPASGRRPGRRTRPTGENAELMGLIWVPGKPGTGGLGPQIPLGPWAMPCHAT